jgi:hypothetical protein
MRLNLKRHDAHYGWSVGRISMADAGDHLKSQVEITFGTIHAFQNQLRQIQPPTKDFVHSRQRSTVLKPFSLLVARCLRHLASFSASLQGWPPLQPWLQQAPLMAQQGPMLHRLVVSQQAPADTRHHP